MATQKRIALSAIIAALYATLTIAIAPLSYGPVQFRFSEALKALVIIQPWTIPGIMIGTLISNLFSPYVSVWELVWMPLSDGVGGLMAWWLAKRGVRPALALLAYAITTALSVGFMLYIVAGLPFLVVSGTVVAGEMSILLGWPIARQMKAWGLLRP